MFEVILKQRVRGYDETIYGKFEDLEDAQEFAKAVITHFVKSSVTISYTEEIKNEEGEQ